MSEKFGNFRVYIDRNYHEISTTVSTTVYVLNNEEKQGLTAQRIQKFENASKNVD